MSIKSSPPNFPLRERDNYIDVDYLQSYDWPEVCNVFTNPLILLKYDGIWAQVEIIGFAKTCKIYSRTGQLKRSFILNPEQQKYFGEHCYCYRGEFMFGQQWAQQPQYKNKVFLWECVVFKDENLRGKNTFEERYDLCDAVPGFEQAERVPQMPLENIETYFKAREFEGVVICKPNSLGTPTFYRYKPDLEDDVIITGFEVGNGRLSNTLGAVLYGVVENNKLVTKGSCGGGFSDELRDEIWNNKDRYLHKVITVTSKLRFKSGALRSANFKCFHKDKTYNET